MLGWSNLTSAEVVGSEELHALLMGSRWTRARWHLGRFQVDRDGAEAACTRGPGVAGQQDLSELAQQAGGLAWAGLGKYHLLHAALGALRAQPRGGSLGSAPGPHPPHVC